MITTFVIFGIVLLSQDAVYADPPPGLPLNVRCTTDDTNTTTCVCTDGCGYDLQGYSPFNPQEVTGNPCPDVEACPTPPECDVSAIVENCAFPCLIIQDCPICNETCNEGVTVDEDRTQCTSNDICGDGEICLPSVGGNGLVCVEAAGLGSECTGETSEVYIPCAPGFYCDVVNTTKEDGPGGVCIPIGALDGPCAQQQQSDTTLRCKPDGTFFSYQANGTHEWCVEEDTGEVIDNTFGDINSHLPGYCNQLEECCNVSIGSINYCMYHGVSIPLATEGSGECRIHQCDDGELEAGDLYPDQNVCIQTGNIGEESCMYEDEAIKSGEGFDSECNYCICDDGEIECTDRPCENEDPCDCSEEPIAFFCGVNQITYPNLCEATCANLNQSNNEFTPGACSFESVCQQNPCGANEFCVPIEADTCINSGCSFRHCYDPNVFRCALEEGHPVCGSNGVTYPSACALYQQTVGTVTLKWPYACDDEVNCPQQQVCGRDRRTYDNRCSAQANGVFVDYIGECEPVDSMSVSGYCEAVSQSNRCPSLVGCSFAAQPVQGCCPICGGDVVCSIDEQALAVLDATTTQNLFLTNTLVTRLLSEFQFFVEQRVTQRCNVRGIASTTSGIEILFEAVIPQDGSFCADAATVFEFLVNTGASPTEEDLNNPNLHQELQPYYDSIGISYSALQVANAGDPVARPSDSSAPHVAAATIAIAIASMAAMFFA